MDQVYNVNNWKTQGYRVHFWTINEMKKLFHHKLSREAICTSTFALGKLSYTNIHTHTHGKEIYAILLWASSYIFWHHKTSLWQFYGQHYTLIRDSQSKHSRKLIPRWLCNAKQTECVLRNRIYPADNHTRGKPDTEWNHKMLILMASNAMRRWCRPVWRTLLLSGLWYLWYC